MGITSRAAIQRLVAVFVSFLSAYSSFRDTAARADDAPLRIVTLSQPISVDSIAGLYDSEWPIGPLLTFVASRLSTDPSETQGIIDDLQYLATERQLVIAATKSAATASTVDDSLSLYVSEKLEGDCDAAWKRIQTAFEPTYVQPQSIGIYPPPHKIGDPFRPSDQYSVELRTAPASQPTLLPVARVMPLLRTRSALGVLMWVTQAEYATVMTCDEIGRKWKLTGAPDDAYYAVEEIPESERSKMQPIRSHSPYSTPTSLEKQRYSGKQYFPKPEKRHYIGIIKGSAPSGEAYVSVTYHGEQYYIRRCDEVSQRNFELIGQLLIMQSVTPSSPPPTPTISVGGH